ncbi:putative integral membrane protein [Halobacteroides halobius DSM 5150]|uniref:Putative integral membrane protein n=1 Tax=Halobacteroides halobius (strain ATCC 35273 / DSM 5150 / MD-1) TaxID=748449 RepID=L0K9R0_HALHC|nr:YggT family protein [Halobacteroides halobius]AGB40818.1 putative integral membrane protein [Halobacteroides halobius DSM 5150]
MFVLINLVNLAYKAYSFILLARIIASWVQPPTDHQFMRKFMRFIYQATEPVLAPIRQMIPLPGIDLSPLIAYLALDIIRDGLIQLLLYLA